MKLDYFTLLCFDEYEIEGVASVKSPTLREISKLKFKFDEYQSYLFYLSLTIESYYKIVMDSKTDYFKGYNPEDKLKVLNIKNEYDSFTDEGKNETKFFDILIYDKHLFDNVQMALSFFISDSICFSAKEHCIQTFNGIKSEDGKLILTGVISRLNYDYLTNIILQRVGIDKSKKKEEEIPIFKNAKAEERYRIMHEDDDIEEKKINETMSIPNLLSSLASRDSSLNIINIWDITVFQLYDQCKRKGQNNVFDIESSSVATYGNSENKFDLESWHKPI